MKKLLALALGLVMVLQFTACSSSDSSGQTTQDQDGAETGQQAQAGETEPAQTDAKTCLISTISSGTPFCQLVWEGFEKLEADHGMEVKLIEALDNAEYEEQIRSMAEAGYNPIYTMFDALNAEVVNLAPEYPDTVFYMIDSALEYDGLDNVCSLIVDPTESSFIAGYVAAKTTETGTIGWVGSLDQANINRFRDGYVGGARYADPGVEILTAYTGDNNDSEMGRECGVSQISGGADVIFQSANLSGLGVIAACADAGIKAIGVDSWQGDIDDCVYWSSLKDVDSAVYQTAQEYLQGSFQSGSRYFVLATGARAYDARDFDALPAELQADVESLVQEIVSGSIDVEALIEASAA